MARPPTDLAGQRFGRLIAVSYAGGSKWQCKCDCGGETVVWTGHLRRKHQPTTSCGCLAVEGLVKRSSTLGGRSRSRAYASWGRIKSRCLNPNDNSYYAYGAKGITIEPEWVSSFQAFFDHIGEAPSWKHTVDRIDNSKGYVPGNVRWATALEQGSNKSNNVHVIYQGERMTVAQLIRKVADECQIEDRVLKVRLRRAIRDKVKALDSAE